MKKYVLLVKKDGEWQAFPYLSTSENSLRSLAMLMADLFELEDWSITLLVDVAE